jgi:uncharacterized protein YcfL
MNKVILLTLLVLSLFVVGCSSPEVVDDATTSDVAVDSVEPTSDTTAQSNEAVDDANILTQEDENFGDLI